MRSRAGRLASAVCVAWLASASAQIRQIPVESAAGIEARKVKAEAAAFKGRQAMRVTDAADTPGAAEAARGFAGIAFRVASGASGFECFYLRPANGRAEDQVRRNHSAQYVSYPDFPWHRLRKESPEKYESYVDLVPGEWTRVRVEVSGTRARLYVHGASQPSLIVNELKRGDGRGAVALWIGPGTVAHFANVRITEQRP